MPLSASGQTRLGRYELLGTLGQGNFATVYRALDPLLGREVAIKALLSHLAAQPKDRTRFLDEARALATLRHPNIVEVFDVGEADGRPFFAMELVEGQPLDRLLSHGRLLPLQRVLLIVRDIAAAVDELHRAGFVHRDLKPANVMVTPAGHAKLMDFGIALATGRARLTQGYGLGTAEYASPEQIVGQFVGPPTDIYALGALTYHLLTGSPPFTGDVAHVVYAQAHLQPPHLGNRRLDLPPSFSRAVEHALSKEPGKRPRTAQAFVNLLEGRDASKTASRPGKRKSEQDPAPAPRHEVDLDLFGMRACAVGIDGVIVLLLFIMSSGVTALRNPPGWRIVIGLLLCLLYLWWGDATGRSVGKRLLHLVVVREADGRAPGVLLGLGRTLGFLLSTSVLGLGLWSSLWNPKDQTWHDRLAHTSVRRI